MDTNLSFILLFGISGGEIFIILLLILILFGPKKIPEIARSLGKGINEIKKVQRDINAEIHRYSEEIDNPAREIKEDIEGFSRGLTDAEKKSPSGSPTEKDKNGKVSDAGPEDLPYPYNQSSGNSSGISDEDKEDSDPDETEQKKPE